MGSGKSSVGRLAADVLHFTFLDTDHVIEARAGKSVSDIFAQDGEPAFRQWEQRIVEELTRRDKTVIATGGGLPADPANLASLKTHALVVCLWASPETIWERVRSHDHRPLLNEPDPLAKIRELLAAREPHYRQADVLVNTEMRSLARSRAARGASVPHGAVGPSMKAALRQRAWELGFDDCRVTSARAPESAPRFYQWLAEGRHGQMTWLARNTPQASGSTASAARRPEHPYVGSELSQFQVPGAHWQWQIRLHRPLRPLYRLP